MISYDKTIGATMLGGALMLAGAALAQAPGAPYFYRFDNSPGVYYEPGTPVLEATTPVAPAPAGTPAGPPPLALGSAVPSPETLMTGRSVAVGIVGNHCQTMTMTCRLDHSSIQGRACSCKVPGGRSHGTVVP